MSSSASQGQQDIAGRVPSGAQFKVTSNIVNPAFSRFSATIGGVGNSLINEGGAFEPVVIRSKYVAAEDSLDRVYVAPESLSQYDTWKEGSLDQADVHIYRIEGGKFKLVREDRIAEGGFHVSGWRSLLKPGIVVEPNASQLLYQWDIWNRPNVNYYFTVRALDNWGRLSPQAVEIAVRRPETVRGGAGTDSLAAFRPKRFDNIVSKFLSGKSHLPAPKNLRGIFTPEGRLKIQWDPINDTSLAGYIVYQSDYPSSVQKGFYIQLEKKTKDPGERVIAGDMVIVSKKFTSISRNQLLSNRVWGAEAEHKKLLPELVRFFPDESSQKYWRLMKHEKNALIPDAGETFFRIELGEDVRESIYTYNYSGISQSRYEVLEKKPYRVEVWLRQTGKGSVRFKVGGMYESLIQKNVSAEFRGAGGGWKKYSFEFTPHEIAPGNEVGTMGLEFIGPGTFDVDNFRVYRADTEFLDLFADDYDQLRYANLLALRTHAWIGTKLRSYDMDQLTNSAGVISGSREKPNTLPQLLKIFRNCGLSPWLQIEFHMTPQEWLGLAEYLAATYDPKVDSPQKKPWAYKRYTQGQRRPWTNEFEQIYFELGNETWNSIFRPWTFDEMTDAKSRKVYSPGEAYGLFQEYVISMLRASPYWRESEFSKKFQFVLGGRGGHSYGFDAARVSPSSDFLTIAAYNGGWDEKEGPSKADSAGFFDVLSQVNQTAIPIAERHAKELAIINSGRIKKLRLGTYESGPGYALNGLNNARVTAEQMRTQEQVAKSLASGTATLDSFLARAYRGFEIQNFFTYGRGELWKSHAKWYAGGHPYPSWKVISLFNREAIGGMLRVESLNVPTETLRAFNQRKSVSEAPMIAAYATKKADRFTLVLISRKVQNYPNMGDSGIAPVTVNLPFNSVNAITLYRMTGDPKENNVDSDRVKLEKLVISPSSFKSTMILNDGNGAIGGGLPPASTYMYVFEGAK